MGEPEVDTPIVPPEQAQAPVPIPVTVPGRARSPWVRGVACVAMIPLLGFIGRTGGSLWDEWKSLRRDQVGVRESAIVGYVDINPNPSYAARPDDWFHHEGSVSLLWSGWKEGEHRWFRFAKGDLDAKCLSTPIGRDVIRVVDFPIYEQAGGQRWGRVPPEASVFGFEQDGRATAYPLKVLNKVGLVNELIGDRPVLVVLTPKVELLAVFEATLDGRRVTMGHGGYFRGHQPVLYDRGTESLWAEQQEGMVAIAGPRKGASLRRIAKPDAVAWGDWREGHADGRLLIGADRSRSLPVD